MSLVRYDILLKKQKKSIEMPSIIPHLPNVTDKDYKRGYIKRYFVQKANDKNSEIFEINNARFNVLANNPYYLVASIDWRIKGLPEEVKNSNKESTRLVFDKLPKLSLYLPNLLQFYKK
jgi:hypothetical protein